MKLRKSLCNEHCGCVSRKRRSSADLSPFGLLIIDKSKSDDIQSLEVLALIEVVEDVGPIRRRFEDPSNEISVFGNSPSRLRRSADVDNLNQLYSSITDRLDEIDDLFEGSVSKF